MHLTTVIPLVLAAAPAAVYAAGTLGFALGTKLPSGACKTTADYEADFDAIKSLSTVVRGYDVTDCNFGQEILPAAKSKGFKVMLGIWADTEKQYNGGKTAVQSLVAQYPGQVHAVTVGSESIYRGDQTGPQLARKVMEVKELVSVPVGSVDSWNVVADGQSDEVLKVSDIILINAFGYWQGAEIANATEVFFDDIMQALNRVQMIKGSLDGFEFAVGETGWPTGGSAYGAAEPGFQNAERFFKEGICGMLAWDVDVYAFEAFDETWKPLSKGDNGEWKDETHWGVFTADRKQKYDLKCSAKRSNVD